MFNNGNSAVCLSNLFIFTCLLLGLVSEYVRKIALTWTPFFALVQSLSTCCYILSKGNSNIKEKQAQVKVGLYSFDEANEHCQFVRT